MHGVREQARGDPPEKGAPRGRRVRGPANLVRNALALREPVLRDLEPIVLARAGRTVAGAPGLEVIVTAVVSSAAAMGVRGASLLAMRDGRPQGDARNARVSPAAGDGTPVRTGRTARVGRGATVAGASGRREMAETAPRAPAEPSMIAAAVRAARPRDASRREAVVTRNRAVAGDPTAAVTTAAEGVTTVAGGRNAGAKPVAAGRTEALVPSGGTRSPIAEGAVTAPIGAGTIGAGTLAVPSVRASGARTRGAGTPAAPSGSERRGASSRAVVCGTERTARATGGRSIAEGRHPMTGSGRLARLVRATTSPNCQNRSRRKT